MTRAGKEPAEDVKRAFRRATHLAGLRVHSIKMFKTPGLDGRTVMGSANPEGWPHECPAVELTATVRYSGEATRVEIRCAASDEEPIQNIFIAPTVQACSCDLGNLPATLKAVWAERQQIVHLAKQGTLDLPFVGRWTWESPDAEC